MNNSLQRYLKFKAEFLLLIIICFCIFISCKPIKNIGLVSSGYSGGYFYKLRLTKQKFDSLKNHFTDTAHDNHLILQFYYPASPTGGSPTLYAYTATHGQVPTGDPGIILDYDSVTSEPLTGRDQVLGDLHIRIDSLKDLIYQAGGDTSYQYFLFTPVYHPDNPHEAYTTQAVGNNSSVTTGSKKVDPSPPAPPY